MRQAFSNRTDLFPLPGEQYGAAHAAAALGEALFLALLLMFSAQSALAQDQHAAHSPATGLPVLVNGAETPERIPDHLAYSHFIIAAAEPDSPTGEQLARRIAVLAPVRLSKGDQASFIATLRGVRQELDFNAQEVERLSGDRAPQQDRILDLRLHRTRVLDSARLRLATSLSPDGVARLDAFIQTVVKRRIVIYGDQPE